MDFAFTLIIKSQIKIDAETILPFYAMVVFCLIVGRFRIFVFQHSALLIHVFQFTNFRLKYFRKCSFMHSEICDGNLTFTSPFSLLWIKFSIWTMRLNISGNLNYLNEN